MSLGKICFFFDISSHLLQIDLCILCTAKKGSYCLSAYRVTFKINYLHVILEPQLQRRKYPKNLRLLVGQRLCHCPGTFQRWTRQLCSRPETSPKYTLKIEGGTHSHRKKTRTKEHPLPSLFLGLRVTFLFCVFSFFVRERCVVAFLQKLSSVDFRGGRCVVWSIFDGYACWHRLYDQEPGGTDVPRPGHHLRCLVEPIPSDSVRLGSSGKIAPGQCENTIWHKEIC